jgi:hypothetical protein
VIHDRSGSVAHVEQHLEQPGVAPLAAHATLQLDHVAERGERPVHQPDHVSQDDLVRRAAQPIPALAPALAHDQPGVLQQYQDRLEELLGDLLLRRDAVDLDDAASFVSLRQVEQRFQRIQPAAGELHRIPVEVIDIQCMAVKRRCRAGGI